MTKEHIIPRAHGGKDEEFNYVASCNRCNSLRGTLNFEFFTKIVANLFSEDGFKEHWHTNDFFIQKCLRKAVQLEKMYAYAYAFVCKYTAFAVIEMRKQNPLR